MLTGYRRFKPTCFPDKIARCAGSAMESELKLTILTTGGTIDKIYFDAKSHYQIGEPQIADILRAFRVGFEFDVIPLMKKDSLELTDQDRNLIYETIESNENNCFLITHGTDTMIETAGVLKPLENDNVIVMTGALNPARFIGSDAVFNIGCAVAAAQIAKNGIYIAMNGRVWSPDAVRKNREENRFEEI